jgi:hypothetical protein
MYMKRIYILFIFGILILFTAFQCSGNLFLTSGYEYDIMVHLTFSYNDTIVERSEMFYPGETYMIFKH